MKTELQLLPSSVQSFFIHNSSFERQTEAVQHFMQEALSTLRKISSMSLEAAEDKLILNQ